MLKALFCLTLLVRLLPSREGLMQGERRREKNNHLLYPVTEHDVALLLYYSFQNTTLKKSSCCSSQCLKGGIQEINSVIVVQLHNSPRAEPLAQLAEISIAGLAYTLQYTEKAFISLGHHFMPFHLCFNPAPIVLLACF